MFPERRFLWNEILVARTLLDVVRTSPDPDQVHRCYASAQNACDTVERLLPVSEARYGELTDLRAALAGLKAQLTDLKEEHVKPFIS